MMMNRPMQMMSGPMNGMVAMPLMGYSNQMPMNMPRVVMTGPPPNFGSNNGPPGAQPHSNLNTAQTMNNLMRNSQSNMAPPGTGMIPPGTHVNPNVYPHFGRHFCLSVPNCNFFLFRSVESPKRRRQHFTSRVRRDHESQQDCFFLGNYT